ncbi:YslB family protein [Bacillus marinisedimentorum]|uniref:YslB family protein n=1 Tax=Bacillus marinisedimentorum TaxID=1821260 RepID=UPI000872228B|nr:YslB family protein [Bacillus marinisedimentorum]
MKSTKTSLMEAAGDLPQVSAFGVELLRNDLLKDMLGKEYSSILYWSGKNIARKYPLSSTEEFQAFFAEAGWGDLDILQQKSQEMTFSLKGSVISTRFELYSDFSCNLEAGFLAEQIQRRLSVRAEAIEQKKKRSHEVLITVQWDKKDPVDGQ